MPRDGAHFDRLVLDELGSDVERRELIVQRADGSTYSAEVPADMDLGEVLDVDETVAHDAGTQ